MASSWNEWSVCIESVKIFGHALPGHAPSETHVSIQDLPACMACLLVMQQHNLVNINNNAISGMRKQLQGGISAIITPTHASQHRRKIYHHAVSNRPLSFSYANKACCCRQQVVKCMCVRPKHMPFVNFVTEIGVFMCLK